MYKYGDTPIIIQAQLEHLLQHTATLSTTLCNTLYNTLQHTATHCNRQLQCVADDTPMVAKGHNYCAHALNSCPPPLPNTSAIKCCYHHRHSPAPPPRAPSPSPITMTTVTNKTLRERRRCARSVRRWSCLR